MGSSRVRNLGGGLVVQKWTASLAAAGATLRLTGLDLSAYETFFVVAELKNNGAVDGSVSMYFGTAGGADDTTAANYDRVITSGNGAAASSSRANDAFVGSLRASTTLSLRGELNRELDGKPVFTWRTREYVTTLLEMRVGATMWRTTSNVTSILLSCGVSMAAGSKITVYAFAGNKTAQGTSNPTSPSNGDRFYRTDLGYEIYYNSTISKWLTVQEFPIAGLTQLGASGGTTVNSVVLNHCLPSVTYQLYATRFLCNTYVGAPNNSTNYWIATVYTVNAAGALTYLSSIGTSLDTAAAHTPHESAINALIPTTEKLIYTANNSKTGAPGAVFLWPTVMVRLVIT